MFMFSFIIWLFGNLCIFFILELINLYLFIHFSNYPPLAGVVCYWEIIYCCSLVGYRLFLWLTHGAQARVTE